jgi:phospholipid/cholesterol/gamma-HCH transport system ATP-binding protein
MSVDDAPVLHEPAVRIDRLSARYGGIEVLCDIDADFMKGEISVVLGASGSGKTTLLRHISGLVKPVSGRVVVLGTDLATATEEQMESVRRRIGVLFQQGALLNSISVFDNVRVPLEQHSGLPDPVIDTIVRTKLALVGLETSADAHPSQLSGGMRKRAALARALALDPEILLCDEPSSGLDPLTARSLDRLLRDLQRQLGMTMIVISHDIASVRRTADRLFFLHQGEILYTGSIADAETCERREVRDFLSAAD